MYLVYQYFDRWKFTLIFYVYLFILNAGLLVVVFTTYFKFGFCFLFFIFISLSFNFYINIYYMPQTTVRCRNNKYEKWASLKRAFSMQWYFLCNTVHTEFALDFFFAVGFVPVFNFFCLFFWPILLFYISVCIYAKKFRPRRILVLLFSSSFFLFN